MSQDQAPSQMSQEPSQKPALVDSTVAEHVANQTHGPEYGVDWVWHDDEAGIIDHPVQVDGVLHPFWPDEGQGGKHGRKHSESEQAQAESRRLQERMGRLGPGDEASFSRPLDDPDTET